MSDIPRRVIATRLHRLVRQRRAHDVLALALVLVTGAVLVATAIAALLWSGWLVLVAVVPVAVLAVRWLRRDTLPIVTYEVETRFPEVKGKLRAAYELAQYDKQGREGYSVEMLEMAVSQVEAALRPLPLGRLAHRKHAAWSSAAVGAAAVVAILLLLVLPMRMRVGLANAFAPDRLDVTFVVAPGDTAVMPGANAVLRCRVEPRGVFGAVWLEQTGKQNERTRVKLAGDSCAVTVAAGSGFRYRFRALGAVSAEHRLRVLEPLALTRLAFTFHYPEYSGLPDASSSSPDISVLRGTVVEVEGTADRLLGSARLVLGGETLGLAIAAEDSSRVSGRFTVMADAEGALELAESDGGIPRPSAVLRVRALGDEPPFVKLFMPGRDVDLPVSMQIPLGINAIDDFGLGELYLHYGKDTIDKSMRIKGLAGRREDTTVYAWDLSQSDLLPGEVMRYYVTVTDNDRVSGPKTGQSETYSVRFPTMTETYSEAVRQTERTNEELGPMQTQQEQLSGDLNRVADEMKRNRELSWDEKQSLSQTLSGQQSLMQQAEDLRAEVQQMKEDLSQGMSYDKETMDRLGQLQELLSQMLPRELQQSLAALRDKLEKQSPDVKQALEKFQLDQEKFKANIERALDLLKRIAEEQQLEELARKADALAEQQQQLTDKLGKEPDERAAALQQDLKAGLDSLLKAMGELGDSMSDKEIGDSLQQLTSEADQQQLSERAADLQNQMQQGKGSQSKPQSGSLSKDMKRMGQALSSLSKRLKDKRSQDVARKLTSAASDLLMVSRQQEEMEQAMAGARDLTEKAPEQMSLADATRIVAESLASLAGQSMSVPPGLGQELARAMNAMQTAAQAMVENRSGAARGGMSGARQGLNRAALALLAAAGESQQGGGLSGGMESLMEQLSQMAAGQMGLNSEMGGMPIPMPGGLTPGQMQSLARILAKQQALREQLQQMMQSMGGTQPGLTSSMEGVLDDMLKVERDLSELNVTRELVDRQESILSHLLDAQRSIRQQGFKEERESEAGKPFEIKDRPVLPADAGERNRLLREELMRALKQGYPPEYEAMIRAYFERLLNAP